MVEPMTSRLVGLCLAAALLTACAAQPTAPRTPAPATRPNVTADSGRAQSPVIEIALAMVGAPYAYGGADPRGFDCSGLVWYAYSRSGFDVPRTALDLYRAARKIGLDVAAPGDLVFFQDEAQLSHVGIYLGGERFVHAPASGRSVSIANLDDAYYRMHLVGVGRIADL